MFVINSVFDVISIISFFLSFWLAIHKLFLEGKPKIKFDAKFSTLYNVNDDTKYLSFCMMNSGSGDIYLTNCGFYTNDGKKQIVLPGGYRTIPLGVGFPYTLIERKQFEVLYPIETFRKIDQGNRITHFFTSDENGKDWKYRIAKFRKSVLEK